MAAFPKAPPEGFLLNSNGELVPESYGISVQEIAVFAQAAWFFCATLARFAAYNGFDAVLTHHCSQSVHNHLTEILSQLADEPNNEPIETDPPDSPTI